MSITPLFSTYRQGENRVTGSMMAAFERLDAGLLERLLSALMGEADVALVKFRNQVAEVKGSVPDAAISGSFDYVFEVKTKERSLTKEQLTRHLKRFDDEKGSSYDQRRLIALTPDAAEPAVIAEIRDDRLTWASFAQLAQAIEEILSDEKLVVSEQSRFLLRELFTMFEYDGLLDSNDVVIVVAGLAYKEYLAMHAYVCQPEPEARSGRTSNDSGFMRSRQSSQRSRESEPTFHRFPSARAKRSRGAKATTKPVSSWVT